MKTRPIDPLIVSAFAKAGSSHSALIPRLVVDRHRVKRLPLRVLEGPYRDLGHIILSRLTLTADPIAYFSFGCILIAAAWHALAGRQSFDQIELQRFAKSNISTLVLRVWNSDDEFDTEKFNDSDVVELNRDIFWLSPLASYGLDECDSPVAGVIRGHMSGVPLDEDVPTDGSAMYLSATTRGAIAMGKTLISFAIGSDSEFVQFEHSSQCGGVGRTSYEIECLLSDSFASDALFGS